MHPFNVGWVAGLFEGEGTIVIRGTDRRRSARVAVGSTDVDVVERLQVLVGGKLNGPYLRGLNKPIWHWRIDKQADVEEFLLLMRPHLGARRGAKADEALAVIAEWHERQPAVWKAAGEKNPGFAATGLGLAA